MKPTIKRRQSPALQKAASRTAPLSKKQNARSLTQRRQSIEALCGEVAAFWKGKPDTGAAGHLIKLRRGAA